MYIVIIIAIMVVIVTVKALKQIGYKKITEGGEKGRHRQKECCSKR